MDYPPEYLLDNTAISFHKFWQIDPFYIYEKWLRDTPKIDKPSDDYRSEIVYKSDMSYDGYCSNDQQQIDRPLCERQRRSATNGNTFTSQNGRCEDVNNKISKEKHIDL